MGAGNLSRLMHSRRRAAYHREQNRLWREKNRERVNLKESRRTYVVKQMIAENLEATENDPESLFAGEI